MNRIASAFLLFLVVSFSACSTAEEKAKMENNSQAVADSLMNAAPADTGAPQELSPAGEEQH